MRPRAWLVLLPLVLVILAACGESKPKEYKIGAILAHVVRRAEEGWFPCTPGAECCFPSRARACGPGVGERFLRKRDDPALAEHLALVRGSSRSEP